MGRLVEFTGRETTNFGPAGVESTCHGPRCHVVGRTGLGREIQTFIEPGRAAAHSLKT